MKFWPIGPVMFVVAAWSGVGVLAQDRASAAEPVLRARGKAIYRAHCLRCHGEDGSETALYPGVKSLVGITERLTAEEVVARSTGFVGVQFGGEQAAALVAYLATLRADGHAKPGMLVETAWVAEHRDDPGVRVVDMRGAAAYEAGHIPGAARVEEGPLRNPEDRLTYLPEPAAFARLMERAGIGNETQVVVYDDQGGRMAARLWYVLAAFGHDRVSLVNGGWGKWAAEGRPTSTEAPVVAAARFVPKATPALSCPSPEVLARKPGVVVLDTRSAAEYAGEQASGRGGRAGHIPGAVNVEWRENVTGPHLVFKPAEELKKLYASRGITPEKEIIAHCATGGRAAQTLFTLKLLGYPKVRVYYGSFSDYTSRPETPVER